MAKKKQSMFGGRTRRSMEKSTTNYGYLNLAEDVNMFKPEGATEVVFDIIPYPVTDKNHMDNKKYADDAVVGELWWKRPIKIHRDVGPEGVTVICPTTIGEKCPICEYGGKRRKEGADWNDELKDIFPKNRTLFLIVPVDADECEVDYTPGEIHVMDQSDHNFLEFLDEEVGRDIDNEDFPNPYNGKSLQVYFRKKKLGKKVTYAEASKIDFIDREEQYDDDFMAEVPSLDDMMIIHTYKELEALYFGMGELDDDIDDQELEEEPKEERRRSSRSHSRKSEDEEEKPRTRTRKTRSKPEPEEEPEEEDEEEKEEKPVTRRRKPKPKPEPEEEEEQEEEEEKPKTRTRKPRESKNKCPFGHKFGEDNDAFDDCDKCDKWDDCADEKDNM